MSSTLFPGSVDSPTDPLATQKLNSPSHSAQHGFENDAIVAIETYAGPNDLSQTAPVAATVLKSETNGKSRWAKVDITTDVAAASQQKGDLFVAQSSTVIARLPAGTDNYALVSRSSAANGIDWEVVPADNVVTLTAGESISQGNAVSVGDGATVSASAPALNSDGVILSSTTWEANSFTTSAVTFYQLTAASQRVHNTSGSAGVGVVLKFDIRTDSAGVPSATSLYAGTNTFNIASSQDLLITHTLSSPLTLALNTKYWVVVSCTSNGGGQIQYRLASTSANVAQSTTNAGTVWSAASNDGCMGYSYTTSVAGNIYQSNATNSDFRANAFAGIAQVAIAPSASGAVKAYGIDASQSGLSPGITYFLSNTPGAISSSAGSQARKIGLSVSAAQLLIKQDNP